MRRLPIIFTSLSAGFTASVSGAVACAAPVTPASIRLNPDSRELATAAQLKHTISAGWNSVEQQPVVRQGRIWNSKGFRVEPRHAIFAKCGWSDQFSRGARSNVDQFRTRYEDRSLSAITRCEQEFGKRAWRKIRLTTVMGALDKLVQF